MQPLIRLVYASKSTSTTGHSSKGINIKVGRILNQSRRNNSKLQIGGVLFFGDGHFFQVLEGPQEAVQELYQRIIRDKRHTRTTVLSNITIEHRLFGDWSMKYVPTELEIRERLSIEGHSSFDPFKFDHNMIQTMVNILNVNQSANPLPEEIKPPTRWQKLCNAFMHKRSENS